MQASPSPARPASPAGPPAAVCGFLVLDKPAGLTSHACVSRVRRAYGLRRVGHGGTLDPMVTGVLPIALGPATRLLPYLPGEKAYQGVIQLGLRTSSDDLQGEVLERRPCPPLTTAQLELALEPFRGPILQRPPAVSAVHVQGERAYVRARRGEDPVLTPRPVTIQRLELLGWDAELAQLEIALACSAGTYVRSLARDLGAALGCGGALASLRRTAALGYGLSSAIPLDALGQEPRPPLQDPLAALAHLPHRHLQESELIAWRCGRPVAEAELTAAVAPAAVEETDAAAAVVVTSPDRRLAGIARRDGQGWLRPRLVLEAAG